jgi:hypothetical protein
MVITSVTVTIVVCVFAAVVTVTVTVTVTVVIISLKFIFAYQLSGAGLLVRPDLNNISKRSTPALYKYCVQCACVNFYVS